MFECKDGSSVIIVALELSYCYSPNEVYESRAIFDVSDRRNGQGSLVGTPEMIEATRLREMGRIAKMD